MSTEHEPQMEVGAEVVLRLGTGCVVAVIAWLAVHASLSSYALLAGLAAAVAGFLLGYWIVAPVARWLLGTPFGGDWSSGPDLAPPPTRGPVDPQDER